MTLPSLPLPSGIGSRYVDCTPSCGLNFHVLEAGHDPDDPSTARRKPLLVLLHGYPELAYSWRRIMLPLAASGYHVIAPDQRGYGRTTGWDTRPYAEVDLSTFKVTQLMADVVCLVRALGHDHVHCLIGHDFGAFATGMAAMARPDFFRACVIMSHPFNGGPAPPFNVADPTPEEKSEQDKAATIFKETWDPDIHENLKKLNPPRKHYQWYTSTAPAAEDWYCAGDERRLKEFFRGYVHLKSADWAGNDPRPLPRWTADVLQTLPNYYVMPYEKTMPETVAGDMVGEDASRTKRWLPDDELAVYVQEWKRTGFQGALNWYRSNTHKTLNRDLNMFAGRRIECPAMFVTGSKDWGKYQVPGVWDNIEKKFKDLRGVFDAHGGHWPQQEDPEGVIQHIQNFLTSLIEPKSGSE